jgi:hypothetical protein
MAAHRSERLQSVHLCLKNGSTGERVPARDHGPRQNCEALFAFRWATAGRWEDFLPQSLGTGQSTGMERSKAVRQKVVHVADCQVWHVLCSICRH